jgi:hypothetical protein
MKEVFGSCTSGIFGHGSLAAEQRRAMQSNSRALNGVSYILSFEIRIIYIYPSKSISRRGST